MAWIQSPSASARARAKAPSLLAGFRVAGSDLSAHSVLRASVADDHIVSCDTPRRGDGIGRRGTGSLDAPHRRVAAPIERNEPSVQSPDIELAEGRATPRFTTSQQKKEARSQATLGSQLRIIWPVFASKAKMALRAPVV